MLKKMVLAGWLILLWTSSSWAQSLSVKNIDYDQWPRLKIVVSWPGEDETADRYSLRIGSDETPIAAASVHRLDSSPTPMSIVVAIDTSLSLTNNDLAGAKKALIDYIGELKPEEEIAIISFSNNVNIISSFSSDRVFLTRALENLKRGGNRTELYKAILFGLDLLKNHSGRRLLLVVSDGKDEGTGVSSWEVLKAAKEHNIPIAAIGLGGQRTSEERYLMSMESMAQETGGVYRRANNTVALSLAIYDLLKTGGTTQAAERTYELQFDLSQFTKSAEPAVKASLTRSFDNNSQTVEITMTPPIPEQPDESSISESPSVPEEEPDLLRRPLTWVLAGLIAVLVIVLVAVRLLRARQVGSPKSGKTLDLNRSPRQTAFLQPETSFERPAQKTQTSPFVLEFAELGLRFPLNLGTCSLGAAPGNDIRLDIPTVSGRHAEFQSSLVECLIKDLNSTNGTLVNGVAINQFTALKPGDLLKFGTAQAALRRVR